MPVPRPAVLLLALVGIAMLAAACGGGEPAPEECFAAEDGQLVPASCDVPGVTVAPTPTATPTPTDVTPPPPVPDALRQGGCAGCHTIDSVPGMRGTIGPNLSTVGSKGADYIRQSVCDPGAVVAPGFPAGVMPTGFCQTFSGEQIDELVEFLSGLT